MKHYNAAVNGNNLSSVYLISELVTVGFHDDVWCTVYEQTVKKEHRPICSY